MARILIFGGHGKVALLLEPLLAAAGHTVTAVIRNPDHEAEVAATGAQPLVADIEFFDREQLANLISGNDVVVWSAGAGGGSPSRTYAVDRDAAIRAVDAAGDAGVDRFIMVSWLGSRPDHGVAPDSSFFPYAEAKWAADAHLSASALDWTILGPGTLTLGDPTGRIEVDPERSGEVPRADVAAVIVATIRDDSTIGRTIRFISGDEHIGHAIAG